MSRKQHDARLPAPPSETATGAVPQCVSGNDFVGERKTQPRKKQKRSLLAKESPQERGEKKRKEFHPSQPTSTSSLSGKSGEPLTGNTAAITRPGRPSKHETDADVLQHSHPPTESMPFDAVANGPSDATLSIPADHVHGSECSNPESIGRVVEVTPVGPSDLGLGDLRSDFDDKQDPPMCIEPSDAPQTKRKPQDIAIPPPTARPPSLSQSPQAKDAEGVPPTSLPVPRPALRIPRASVRTSAPRRVTFDPSIPNPSSPENAKPPLPPSSYVGRSHLRRPRHGRCSLQPKPVLGHKPVATTPISVSHVLFGDASPEERAIVDQLQYVLDGVIGGARAGGGTRGVDGDHIIEANAGSRKSGSSDFGVPEGEADALLSKSLTELASLLQRMSATSNSFHGKKDLDGDFSATGATTPTSHVSSAMNNSTSSFDAGDPLGFNGEAHCVESLAGQKKPSVLYKLGKSAADVLSSVVARLLALRSRSTLVALLVGTIMLILAESDASAILFDKREVAALVDAFFQSGQMLTENMAGNGSKKEPYADGRDGSAPSVFEKGAKKPRKRRRGKLARRNESRAADAAAAEECAIEEVRAFLSAGCFVEPTIINSIRGNARGVATIFGLALAAVLEVNECARAAMIESRRVHRIVAIFQQAQTAYGKSADEEVLQDLHPIISVALRILEFATLGTECQTIVTRQTPILRTTISVLRGRRVSGAQPRPSRTHSSPGSRLVPSVENKIPTGPDSCQPGAASLVPAHEELSLTYALRLCVNLIRECQSGLARFISYGGLTAVLDLLALPSIWPRRLLRSECVRRENFDVQVVGIVLLANVASMDDRICSTFRFINPYGIEEREGGAVTFILELLKVVGDNGESADMGDNVKNISAQHVGERVAEADRDPVGEDAESDHHRSRSASERYELPRRQDQGSLRIEQRVMVGYLCLLLGALAKGSTDNRSLIMAAMPGNSLLPIAEVLDEFLAFQHDSGVNTSGINAMHCDIISALRAVDDPVALTIRCD